MLRPVLRQCPHELFCDATSCAVLLTLCATTSAQPDLQLDVPNRDINVLRDSLKTYAQERTDRSNVLQSSHKIFARAGLIWIESIDDSKIGTVLIFVILAPQNIDPPFNTHFRSILRFSASVTKSVCKQISSMSNRCTKAPRNSLGNFVVGGYVTGVTLDKGGMSAHVFETTIPVLPGMSGSPFIRFPKDGDPLPVVGIASHDFSESASRWLI